MGHKGRMPLPIARLAPWPAFGALLAASLLLAAPAQALSLPQGLAAEALPHPQGGPALRPADWLAFLGPQAMPESGLAAWAGRALSPEAESGPKHYLLPQHGPYAGGVDLYLNDKNEVEEALFYVACGPLFTADQAEAAKGVRPAWRLFDLQRRLGAPDEVTGSPTSHTTRWFYRLPGGVLVVQSLPDSSGIHRIVASRNP